MVAMLVLLLLPLTLSTLLPLDPRDQQCDFQCAHGCCPEYGISYCCKHLDYCAPTESVNFSPEHAKTGVQQVPAVSSSSVRCQGMRSGCDKGCKGLGKGRVKRTSGLIYKET